MAQSNPPDRAAAFAIVGVAFATAFALVALFACLTILHYGTPGMGDRETYEQYLRTCERLEHEPVPMSEFYRGGFDPLPGVEPEAR